MRSTEQMQISKIEILVFKYPSKLGVVMSEKKRLSARALAKLELCFL